MNSYYYLATPYSKYKGGFEDAYKEACSQAALLFKAGVTVFSPIAHSHSVAKFGNLDATHGFGWLKHDFIMLSNAEGLIICCMKGWKKSYGIAEEITWFAKNQPTKQIIYMEPGIVPERLMEAM